MYKISKKMTWMEGGQLDRERRKDFYQKQKDFNVGACDQVEVKIIQQCLKTILYKISEACDQKAGAQSDTNVDGILSTSASQEDV